MAAIIIRETILHWVGAQLLTAGTGVETRSAQQVSLMRDFGVTVLTGFGDFATPARRHRPRERHRAGSRHQAPHGDRPSRPGRP
ncbi:MAG: hypothetical protein WDO24_03730 [Pseudomonadota bacterium]